MLWMGPVRALASHNPHSRTLAALHLAVPMLVCLLAPGALHLCATLQNASFLLPLTAAASVVETKKNEVLLFCAAPDRQPIQACAAVVQLKVCALCLQGHAEIQSWVNNVGIFFAICQVSAHCSSSKPSWSHSPRCTCNGYCASWTGCSCQCLHRHRVSPLFCAFEKVTHALQACWHAWLACSHTARTRLLPHCSCLDDTLQKGSW